jgi:hypothetical protein
MFKKLMINYKPMVSLLNLDMNKNMIHEEHIPSVKDVRPVVTAIGNDPSKVKFGSVFANPYNTTFLCAKRKSGKTSVLAEILDKTSNKHTVFWIFCPTTNIDDSWKAILKSLTDKGAQVNVFDSIMDGKTNQLSKIIDTLAKGDEHDEKQIKPVRKLISDETRIEQIRPEKKPKKLSPEHIFVMDDLSHELKNPALYKLLKNGRHLKAAVYLSFQYPNDLLPQGWKNCEYAICFKSFSEDKLEHIHRCLDLTIPIDKFVQLYSYVMQQRGYDFLFIDVKNELYRKNFNKKLVIE